MTDATECKHTSGIKTEVHNGVNKLNLFIVRCEKCNAILSVVDKTISEDRILAIFRDLTDIKGKLADIKHALDKK